MDHAKYRIGKSFQILSNVCSLNLCRIAKTNPCSIRHTFLVIHNTFDLSLEHILYPATKHLFHALAAHQLAFNPILAYFHFVLTSSIFVRLTLCNILFKVIALTPSKDNISPMCYTFVSPLYITYV